MFLDLQPASLAMRNALEMGSIGMVPKGELAWDLQAGSDEVLLQFAPAIHPSESGSKSTSLCTSHQQRNWEAEATPCCYGQYTIPCIKEASSCNFSITPPEKVPLLTRLLELGKH